VAVPALSGTYTFNPSAVYIIQRALRQCQVIAEGETASNAQIQDAAFALNSLIKAWQGSGIHVWCEQDITLFLQPNQTSYQLGAGTPDQWCLSSTWDQYVATQDVAPGPSNFIYLNTVVGLESGAFFGIQTTAGNIFWSVIVLIGSNYVYLDAPIPGNTSVAIATGALGFSYPYSATLPRPLRIPAGRRYIYQGAAGGAVAGQPNEIPLVPMSRLDYAAQPNKQNTGAVTQFFYDPQYDPVGVVYCWPTPQDDSSALKFTSQRQLQDIDVLTNLVDFPKEWINAITWSLALEIAPEFDVSADRYAILEKQAARWFDMASAWDRETGSVLFGFAKDPQYRTG
jgi:hypothetical protein